MIFEEGSTMHIDALKRRSAQQNNFSHICDIFPE